MEAAAYPVTAKVYADGILTSTVTITSRIAQRLLAGFLANVWEFEVTSSVEVYSVTIAETMGDLVNG